MTPPITSPGRTSGPRLPVPARVARFLAFVAFALPVTPAVAQDPAPQTEAPPEYDVVIRDGRVLDGAGNPWIRADLAVRSGRIVRIGRIEGAGRREIDATGLYVSPGFIDMMDQSGGVLPRNGLAENKLRMGVTTAIGGEGGTPVPVEEIEGYFTGLEESGISINFGTYFSETQARVAVLGNSARAPTPEELARMQEMMRAAMRQGVMGMTTALIYPPSSFASTDELIAVGSAAAELGGIYASHIRDEGEGLVTAVREAVAVGEGAGMPVEIFHFKGAYEPGWGRIIREAAAEIDAARARGVDVAADLYPYTAGGTGLEATIPSWVFDGGPDSVRARIGRPDVRARLKEQLVTGYDGWWNIVEAAGGWDGVVLVNARSEENARFEGKTLSTIAEEWGKDPADAAWDLVAQGDGRVMAIYHMMSEDDVQWALRLPWTSIGSDAGAALSPGVMDGLGLPHPRSYGTFPRVLARYVRDLGTLTLQEAVRKMTSWPATRMRLERRGVLREGAWADITIFDLEAMDDRATYEEPVLFPRGIEYVLVNGIVVIEDGERHTGARPGHVLYGPGRRPNR
jgi:N-acyl-D-amino-acid deacylase